MSISNSTFIIIFIGAQSFSDSFAIYHTRVENTNAVIRMIFTLALRTSIAAHVTPVLCLFFYIVIGYPTPDVWSTPYGIHEVLATYFHRI